MKKKIVFTACAWLLSLGHAFADEFIINDVTVPQGGTADLVIGYSFTSTTDKVGFTLSLGLPDGIALVVDDEGEPVYVKDETSIGKLNINCAGEGNFAGLPSNDNATIKGSVGTLFTLTLSADAALAVGSTHTVNVTKATFQEKVEGKVSDINISDFSFTVTIGEPDDGRIKFDENATKLPTYTAGEKGDVTLKRTIKSGEWSTICLPFTLPKAKAEATFGSDAEYYKFSGIETTVDLDGDLKPTAIKLDFSEHKLTSALSSLTGGQPYLIRTNKDITEIKADQVKLVDAVVATKVSDVEYDVLEGRFVGTFVKTTIPANDLFISGNQFWYSTGSTTVKAFRAWFDLDVVLNQEIELSRITLNFLDDTTTGINDNPQTYDDNRYYDLQGRKVAESDKHESLRRGLYIKNGKKIVKK